MIETLLTRHVSSADLAAFCRIARIELDADCMAALAAITDDERRQVILTGSNSDAALTAAVLAWLFLDGQTVLWVTRRPDAARAAFESVAGHATRSPFFSGVRSVTRSNGEQEVRLNSGARALFRTWGRIRGYSAGRLIVGDADVMTHRDADLIAPVIHGRNADRWKAVYTAAEFGGDMLTAMRDHNHVQALVAE